MRDAGRAKSTTALGGRGSPPDARPAASAWIAAGVALVFVVGLALDLGGSASEPEDGERAPADPVDGDVVLLEPAQGAEPSRTSMARRPRWIRHAGAGEDLDDARPPAPDAKQDREVEFLAELRALSRADRAACVERAERIAAGEGPECARSAMLRVAYEEAWPELDSLLARAHVSNTARGGALTASEGFLNLLAARAPGDARARAVLLEAARSALPTAVRVRALRACTLGAPDGELDALERLVRAEPDPELHSAGLVALAEREAGAPPCPPQEDP